MMRTLESVLIIVNAEEGEIPTILVGLESWR